MVPLFHLSALLSLLSRQPDPSASVLSPYITLQTESSAHCRNYPDQFDDLPHGFGNDVQPNATCWTRSPMYLDPRGDPQPNSSFAWLWIQLKASRYLEFNGLGNGDGGNGDELYFPDVVEWCGDAPHHQVVVRKNESFEDFVCRNCTDLADPVCQITYKTGISGYGQTGCWTDDTAVGGNSTWVQLVEPTLMNCFISPDQFQPNDWHGKLVSERYELS
ncbi:hypothetical protein K458DRAFT_388883 [Lentithecium fluviatile CBS 122367]|uniref:Uncharacterized protein n=1 Tax=Lentithecium fluviatile CBS 122367 TaxID=1168545 RepID=A0A6G1J2H1_9PLEO|nr:hypothetical protein K458DRAFT_388883 [Lentithecium fluviatile CBS 122367]